MVAPSQLDAERFPSVARYLALLPNGVDSYPECKIKGSLVRAILEGHPVDARGALPDVVARVLASPPGSSDWVPLVAARCVLRAVFDEYFHDVNRFEAWAYESQRMLFSGRLYKILFWGVGPERLVRMAAARYAHFHQGSTMRAESKPRGGVCMIDHPAHIFGDLDYTATIEGFRAVLEIAGAEDLRATITAKSPRETHMEFTWR